MDNDNDDDDDDEEEEEVSIEEAEAEAEEKVSDILACFGTLILQKHKIGTHWLIW